MKLTCQACQARYTLADDKVRGKLVKIRCRKCGAIVIAQGGALDEPTPVAAHPASEASSEERTGERREQSVLFSLSALQEARAGRSPAPLSPSESSGLIDLRMLTQSMVRPPTTDASLAIAHLGAGGVFAPSPLLAEPTLMGHSAPARQPGSRARGLFAVAGGGVAVGLAVLLTVSVERRGALTLAPAVTPLAALAPAPSAVPPLFTSAASEPLVVATTAAELPTAAEPKPSQATIARPLATTKPVVPAAPSLKPFDAQAAGRALGAVDLRACGRTSGPGAGHVKVTLDPSGAVTDVVIDSSELAGDGSDRCVVLAFRRVKVAPFAGSAVTVGKRFVVPLGD